MARLKDLIDGSDKMSPTKRAELRGKISTMPGLYRFLRVTPAGLLRVDKTKMKAEANLDGKYRTCSGLPIRACPPRTSHSATNNYWKSDEAGAT